MGLIIVDYSAGTLSFSDQSVDRTGQAYIKTLVAFLQNITIDGDTNGFAGLARRKSQATTGGKIVRGANRAAIAGCIVDCNIGGSSRAKGYAKYGVSGTAVALGYLHIVNG